MDSAEPCDVVHDPVPDNAAELLLTAKHFILAGMS